jgi:CarD family transcriptional regulator
VVYPSQGVSVVEIAEEVLGGTTMRCYHLRLLNPDSKVVVPVANADRVGLRPLSEKRAVDRAMRRLRAAEGDEADNWKDRYRANLDRIKTGDLDEVVDVLLCLADVARRKTLSFRERKMFDHARQLLVYEVAAVKGKPAEKVERDIEKALQVQPAPAEESDRPGPSRPPPIRGDSQNESAARSVIPDAAAWRSRHHGARPRRKPGRGWYSRSGRPVKGGAAAGGD